MKYMLLIHTDESGLSASAPEEVRSMNEDYTAYTQALAKAGVSLGWERLQPVTRTASVRVRDGKPEVLDGPYADTKEQLGGYYLLEVPDCETAVEWAKRCPAAARGTVELRPVMEGGGAE